MEDRNEATLIRPAEQHPILEELQPVEDDDGGNSGSSRGFFLLPQLLLTNCCCRSLGEICTTLLHLQSLS